METADADEHIRQLAAKYGKDYELIKRIRKRRKMENLKLDLTQKKVFDFIVQSANIKTIEKEGIYGVEVKS